MAAAKSRFIPPPGQASSADLDGTSILTTLTIESVKSADQVASEEKAGNQLPAGFRQK